MAAVSAAALALALHGCGGGGGGSPSGPGPQGPGAPPVQQPPPDRDGDGVPDARDAFPDDPAESVDSDVDGVGDNADAFPNDASRTEAPDAGAQPTAARLPFPYDVETCDRFSEPDCDYVPQHPPFSLRDMPNADIADARRSPVSHDSSRIFVGVDQGTEHVGALPVIGSRGNTEIRFGALDDGIGEAKVREYLSHAGLGRSIPDVRTVRVIGPSTQEERNRVVAAVRMVNAALPESAKLEIDPALPGRTQNPRNPRSWSAWPGHGPGTPNARNARRGSATTYWTP